MSQSTQFNDAERQKYHRAFLAIRAKHRAPQSPAPRDRPAFNEWQDELDPTPPQPRPSSRLAADVRPQRMVDLTGCGRGCWKCPACGYVCVEADAGLHRCPSSMALINECPSSMSLVNPPVSPQVNIDPPQKRRRRKPRIGRVLNPKPCPFTDNSPCCTKSNCWKRFLPAQVSKLFRVLRIYCNCI